MKLFLCSGIHGKVNVNTFTPWSPKGLCVQSSSRIRSCSVVTVSVYMFTFPNKKQTSPEYLSQVVLILGGWISEAHSAKEERHLPSGCSCSIESNGRKWSSSHQNSYALTLSPRAPALPCLPSSSPMSLLPTSRKTHCINLENVSLEERKFWKTAKECFSIRNIPSVDDFKELEIERFVCVCVCPTDSSPQNIRLARGCDSVVEHFYSMYQALRLIPSNEGRGRRTDRGGGEEKCGIEW